MPFSLLRLACLIVIAWSALASWQSLRAEETTIGERREFFETHIRPVLIEQCYECHNSARKQEGGLALDSRGGLLKGGDSGPAIVPGNPDESLLIQVVRHQLDGVEMPKAAPALPEAAVGHLEQWIKSGAFDPRDHPPSAEDLEKSLAWESLREKRKEWWSFQPIKPQQIPAVQNEAWCRGDVDRFLLARMEQFPLIPSGDADAAVLLRRACFVLNGLPPRPDEIDKWIPQLSVSDPAQRNRAMAALVDDLLARPQFGEHWARHWMDWIRYAESHGSEGDPAIGAAWQYRDYLVRALNNDVPYDQLVREHIAGDLLEAPRRNEELGINESIIGPAHWRMVFHGFTPTDALDERVRFIDDEINVFSKAFLGLTVSCARCHNHKFDAISQADYYALFGVLGSCRPGRNVIDLPEVQNKNLDELSSLKEKIREELAAVWLQQMETRSSGWFRNPDAEKSILAPWVSFQQEIANGVAPEEAWKKFIDRSEQEQQQLTSFREQQHLHHWKFDAGSPNVDWFKSGQNLQLPAAAAGDFTVALAEDKVLSEISPSGLYTHAFSPRHAGRISSPAFPVDEECNVWLHVCGDTGALARYVVQQYPRNGLIYPVVLLPRDWKWIKLDLSYWKWDEAYLELTTALDAPIPERDLERSWFGIREAIVTKKGVSPPVMSLPAGFAAVLEEANGRPIESEEALRRCYVQAVTNAVQAWQNQSMTDAQAELLNASLREGLITNVLSSSPSLQPLVERYRKLEAEIQTPRRVPGLDEIQGRDQLLFVRGDHKHPADPIPRRFLEAIDSTPYDSPLSGRRQLAKDLLRDDNPFTRRVIVNRIWHHVFAQGLVRTPDNFGKMGDQPSHPELLDWLANHFSETGWSFKSLIRELVLSHAWQLDSIPTAEAQLRDPENRFLSHAPIRRLEAESVRDAILAGSGRLDSKSFGPPVGGNSDRRSLYVAVNRNSLDPFLRVFDAPEPFSATGRRDVTNVPAQALTLMNDPNVIRSATVWAERVLADSSLTDSQRVHETWLSAFGRSAGEEEIQRALSYLTHSELQYEDLGQLRTKLEKEQAEAAATLARLSETALNRIAPRSESANRRVSLKPVGAWIFEKDLQDSIGTSHGHAVGNVSLAGGGIAVGPQQYVVTDPVQKEIREKTLEVWVQLASLDQRGGGAITLQTLGGGEFDSIVFGEQAPGEWLAGSNHFRRTQPFHGPIEKEAVTRPVHLAVTYASNGRITMYRNGVQYGTPYQASELKTFPAGQTVLTFGLRHLPSGGNRFLSGQILEAQLYDRVLTAEEIQLSFQANPQTGLPDEEDQLKVLTLEERTEYQLAKARVSERRQQLDVLPKMELESRHAAWSDLIRGTILMKEFVYLR